MQDIIYSKGKTLSGPVSDPKDLPKWNHDRSSTGEALEKDSEVILHPQAVFRDPFHRAKNILNQEQTNKSAVEVAYLHVLLNH
ncbi:glutamine synthetase cytosolic isozyme 1-3-like isoform X2 [Cryptomeria japonica]|uniref:glutamine synthetase cytosolic isozyme 1-3-like isoform X2 n=1 Tax=Cryptomeria japonica TaxID=3369 RepID=UPI0025AC5CCC|nr:glutamine synthetase cytosolic isozyme 1-3-like isoform X2 [Cryptomeria japonica]